MKTKPNQTLVEVFAAEAAKPVTIAAVNAELKRLGHAERLRRGRGYFYFAEGNASAWTQSGVYGVGHVSGFTLEGWIKERDRLAAY